MRVSLISEGAYPHSFGGVSVWCDQLVRRSTSVDFTLVSLVATGNEQPVWQLPENVDGLATIPLWGPAAPRRARLSRSARSEFRPLLQDLLRCLLAERDPTAERRFGQVLRLLFDFAQREDLSAALGSEDALAVLTRAWSEPSVASRHAGDDAERRRDRPGVARPLAAAAGPPAGGHRGGALRGERARGAPGAGRAVDARLGPAPHRARRLPARALPRTPPGPLPVAGQGPAPGVPAVAVRPRLPAGGAHRARQRLQPVVGAARSAPIPASSGRSTTGSIRPSSRRSRASPPCPPSAGPGASTPSRTCTP